MSERNIIARLREGVDPDSIERNINDEDINVELDEAGFESNGSTFTSAFGRYYKDGEPITRDDYFKAKDKGKPTSNKSSKVSANNNEPKHWVDTTSMKKPEFKSIVMSGKVGDILEFKDRFGHDNKFIVLDIKKHYNGEMQPHYGLLNKDGELTDDDGMTNRNRYSIYGPSEIANIIDISKKDKKLTDIKLSKSDHDTNKLVRKAMTGNPYDFGEKLYNAGKSKSSSVMKYFDDQKIDYSDVDFNTKQANEFYNKLDFKQRKEIRDILK